MQYVLSIAATTVLIVGFAGFVISFLSYAWNRAGEEVKVEIPVEVEEFNWEKFVDDLPPLELDWNAGEEEPPLPPVKLPDTIRELRSLCKEWGLKGTGRWTKARCLEELATLV